jgi:thiol:disulfide interchange protein DsbD
VGTLLVLATQGSWSWPVLGLVAFSTAFAAPFFLLALVPHALERLPRSGEWMLTLRRALGVLEIAAAAKFVSNVDLVWRWGVFTREVVVALWALAALALAVVLFGRLRAWRAPVRASMIARAALVLLPIIGAWWLSTGLRGARLGEVEAFLPPPTGALSADGASGDLAWHLNDYPAALARARAQGRPILIDFTGYTCTNCRWMEANMFPRPGVRARLEPFVRARLYTDGEGEPFGAQQALEGRLFGTVALPVYAILTPAGKPVASFTGMTRDAARFEAFLERGLEQARGN